VAAAKSEMATWVLDPFRSLGPMNADSSPSELDAALGPVTFQRRLRHVPGLKQWHGEISVSHYEEEAFVTVELAKESSHVVALDGVPLRGSISSVTARVARLGFEVVELSEGYRIDPAGVSLWVPVGTKTIRSVAVALYPSAALEPNADAPA
jgi:hypothetical protein